PRLLAGCLAQPGVLETGVERGTGEIESRGLSGTFAPDREPGHDPERLCIALIALGNLGVHNDPVQLLLRDVTEGWVSEVVREGRTFDNVRIEPAVRVRPGLLGPQQVLGQSPRDLSHLEG